MMGSESLSSALVEYIDSVHPAGLFGLLVFLPLCGVPASPFWVVLGLRFGLLQGFALACGALILNVSLGFLVARHWLRPGLSAWLRRRGVSIPLVGARSEREVILLVRLAPGLPLSLQNYILGVASVRFGPYLFVSVMVQAAYALGFVWIGESVMQTRVARAAAGVAALLAISMLVRLIRRWLQSRRTA